MSRILPILAISLLFSFVVSAQAYEGKIEYDKKKQAAFVIEFPYPAEAVENGFIMKMDKLGYKGKEEKGLFNRDKGFRVFKDAFITEVTDKKFDYIINVERKKKRDGDESFLYLVILKDGGENAVTEFNGYDMDRAKAFLNNLLPYVEDANLEINITDQENVVSKAEKKLKTLEKEQSDLEDKLKKNQKDQEDTARDIEDQKKALESLKIKRRSTI
ncbi:MAG TPA: hypothetical protein VLJ68_01195 [Chitinophagaceae bacterium]|nr:hypothetical protein [Chitinophagaceae bacterium]